MLLRLCLLNDLIGQLIDEALDEISQKRGVLYDPMVVKACLELFRKKKFDFV